MAADDSAETRRGMPGDVPVLVNDTDIDDSVLTITGFTQGANGEVTDAGGGKLRYTPSDGFVGSDLFTYTVADQTGATDTANVHVMVVGISVWDGGGDGLHWSDPLN